MFFIHSIMFKLKIQYLEGKIDWHAGAFVIEYDYSQITVRKVLYEDFIGCCKFKIYTLKPCH